MTDFLHLDANRESRIALGIEVARSRFEDMRRSERAAGRYRSTLWSPRENIVESALDADRLAAEPSAEALMVMGWSHRRGWWTGSGSERRAVVALQRGLTEAQAVSELARLAPIMAVEGRTMDEHSQELLMQLLRESISLCDALDSIIIR
ncbi:hypothetical protein LQL77_31505 [Rhodococcus cerastii]|nr:hypothetical protein [Rhodococcus cerastii]